MEVNVNVHKCYKLSTEAEALAFGWQHTPAQALKGAVITSDLRTLPRDNTDQFGISLLECTSQLITFTNVFYL